MVGGGEDRYRRTRTLRTDKQANATSKQAGRLRKTSKKPVSKQARSASKQASRKMTGRSREPRAGKQQNVQAVRQKFCEQSGKKARASIGNKSAGKRAKKNVSRQAGKRKQTGKNVQVSMQEKL